MNLFSFFRSKQTAEVEAFAKSLASDIAKRYPPELDNNPSKHPSVHRLTRILEETCQQAAEFQRSRQLGVYGKAKLGNTFRWALTELGYRKQFIEVATEAVVVYMSKSETKNNG